MDESFDIPINPYVNQVLSCRSWLSFPSLDSIRLRKDLLTALLGESENLQTQT